MLRKDHFSFCSVKMRRKPRKAVSGSASSLSVRPSVPRCSLAPVAPNRWHRGRRPEPPPFPLGPRGGSSLSQPGGRPLPQRPCAFSPGFAVHNADKGALVRPRAAAALGQLCLAALLLIFTPDSAGPAGSAPSSNSCLALRNCGRASRACGRAPWGWGAAPEQGVGGK